MLRPVSLLAAALLSTTVLAVTPQARAAGEGVEPISPYAAYLVGRHALASGDKRDGVAALEALATAYPDQPALRLQAFHAALYAGDIEGAATFAPDASSADDPADLASLGRLVRSVYALSQGKPAEANRQLDLKSIEIPYRSAAYMLRPWVLAANGDWTGAAAEPSQGDRVAELVAGLGRAEIFELKGKKTEAEAAYKEIVADAIGQKLFKARYGEFLERTGRTKEAIAYYDAALKLDPENGELAAAHDRAVAGGRPPAVPSLRQGAAQALTFAAAAASARMPALGLDYLRLALKLDPTLDQALLMLGEDMYEIRDGAAARAAWAKVPESSRLYVDARSREAYSLSSEGDAEGAIKLARALAAAQPRDPTAQFTLADILRTSERDAEALEVLDRIEKGDGGKDWRVRYMRAMALDKVGRWSDAEAELKLALELAPDQPDVENYLGYSWIDRGDHVKDGMALVEKAVAARPNSGAMQDSLGWAHYRMGDFKAAVALLEKAVELEPADPDINDHLGDAYWRAGRKSEAGFQWNRVLTLSPDAKLKAAVEHKLHDGLAAPQVAAS
jgi:tetratricopeptide (TPR) repeat protein